LTWSAKEDSVEAAPVDHKDEPGEYRQQVRAAVFDRAGVQGRPVASRDELVGDWLVSFVGSHGTSPKPTLVYRLRSDGGAVIERDGEPPSAENQWRLNDDGSFSLLVCTAAMPEHELPEPTHEERRMHAAVLPGQCIVLWNGDGSLVELLSPVHRGR
jgi:hypothetical protein